jgi:23S rRNA (uracil1939-C5)-methyltransferase
VSEKLDDLWLIVVDPPRDGLHKDVVWFVSNLHKKHGCKILYISCNPVTMARDCRLFADAWIQTKLLQPVDMFPHTHHIETIWLLY